MRPSLLLPSLTTFLAALLAGRPVAAQTVRGTVTASETGTPVTGAVVQLLDSRGTSHSRVLTGAEGGFTLDAPGAGAFRLRVERIGLASHLSEVVELRPGEVREYPMRITSVSATLEGITVSGRSRGCSIRENGETVTRVWEEARKSLDAIALSQSGALVRFDAQSFRRELDRRTGAVLLEQRRASFNHTGNPFRSVPVEELRTQGYVRSFPDSTIYYGPDASVLLSDAFLDTHCFRLNAERADQAGLIGLDFRPAGRLSLPDIAGTLWLDRKTSELRSVEYEYVGHKLDVDADRLGGRIEFERVLPSGAWIVRRWVIRMPVVMQRRSRFIDPATSRPMEHTATTVTAVVEEGGEAVAASAGGARAASGARGAMSGTVVDSLSGRPLEGAIVYLSGTSFSDTTDAAGRYRLLEVPEGKYVVSFIHPKLRTFGIIPAPRETEVEPSSESMADLAIPSTPTLLRRFCPAMTAEDRGVLVGYVKDTRTGAPVPRAQVRVDWRTDTGIRGGSLTRSVTPSGEVKTAAEEAWLTANATEMEMTADGSGFFRFCGSPLQSTVRIEARVGRSVARRSIRVGGDRLSAHELEIDLR